jgi:hypothetical protein
MKNLLTQQDLVSKLVYFILHVYIVQNMSESGSGLLDPGLIKGVKQLVQRESSSASCGAKVPPSLQSVDLSFINSVT